MARQIGSVDLAENTAEEAAVRLAVGLRRFAGGRLGILSAAQTLEPFTQLRIAAGVFDFARQVGLQALYLLLLPGQTRAFLGHRHFHLPHLRHHVLFVEFELAALLLQFAFEAENLLALAESGPAAAGDACRCAFAADGRFLPLLGFLNLLMETADNL